MATKYIVSATPTNPADTEYARKEYAVREAERRANQENRTLVVTVITSAGNQVHETEVIEPKPATGRGGRRDAVTDSAVEGYEVLYEKPAIGAELLRSEERRVGKDGSSRSAAERRRRDRYRWSS